MCTVVTPCKALCVDSNSVLQLWTVGTHGKVVLEKGQGKREARENTRRREKAKQAKVGGGAQKATGKGKDSGAWTNGVNGTRLMSTPVCQSYRWYRACAPLRLSQHQLSRNDCDLYYFCFFRDDSQSVMLVPPLFVTPALQIENLK